MANSELLNREEAAAYLDVKPQTLACWACTKRYGLRYIRVGRNIRYRKRDLDAFLDARTVGAGDSATA